MSGLNEYEPFQFRSCISGLALTKRTCCNKEDQTERFKREKAIKWSLKVIFLDVCTHDTTKQTQQNLKQINQIDMI